MNRGTGVAAGVAAGYLMGRTKKMRLAMMVAAAGLTGRLAKKPGEVVRRGADQLGVSGAAEGLAGTMGGDLATAVKSAAASMATKRIDALSERMSGGPSRVGEDEDQDESEQDERAPAADEKQPREKSSARAGKAEKAEKADEESESEDTDEGADDESYRPVTRRRASAHEDDEEDDAEDGGAKQAHRRSTRSSTRTRSRATTTQRRTRR